MPSVALSLEDISRTYKGFDGDPWPNGPNGGNISIVDGLAPISAIHSVERYFAALESPGRLHDLLLLHVGSVIEPIPTEVHDWTWYGYDYGLFESQWNHFSVVLNEVVFGSVRELRRFSSVLNTRLLLDSRADVEMLHDARSRLVERGAPLESDGDWAIIGVFGRP